MPAFAFSEKMLICNYKQILAILFIYMDDGIQ